MSAQVPIAAYLILAAVLFSVGVAAFLIKRNLITIFMSIELMLNAVNLTFVFLSERHALGTTNIGGYLNHITSNISEISTILFTKLLLPFEVTSVLILVAILGAVVLARKEQ